MNTPELKFAAALTDDRVAAVVVFKQGITLGEAVEALAALDIIDPGTIQAEAYDATHRSPVLYFP